MQAVAQPAPSANPSVCPSHFTIPSELVAALVKKDLLLMSLPCFLGVDKLHPLIKVSWLNLAWEVRNSSPSGPEIKDCL